MGFSMMNEFISKMVVMKSHTLVFPSGFVIIDYADIYYFGIESLTSLVKEKTA